MDYHQPHNPPNYVMLSQNHGSFQPPPYHRNVPRYHGHKSGGNCCLRCICCCYCFLFLLVIVLASLAFYFYAVYQPEVPSYDIKEFTTQAFNTQPDFSLYTEFAVTVKADNPNTNIGFIYGKDSLVEVVYQDSSLCSGQIPAFHQGHKNVTMIKVVLKGKSEFGSGLQEALMDNRKSGKIPITVKVKVPVSIVLGEFPMRQFIVHVTCHLVVDNLTPQKKARVLSNVCTPEIEFLDLSGEPCHVMDHSACTAISSSNFLPSSVLAVFIRFFHNH